MVKKIILEIDGKEIKVTPQEARRLFDDLRELFGESQPTSTTTFTPNIGGLRWIYNSDGTSVNQCGVKPLTVGMNYS